MKRGMVPSDQMAAQLIEHQKKTNPSFYKAQNADHRTEQLAAILQQKIDFINDNPPGKDNSIFHDLELVKHRTEAYIASCRDAGIAPSVSGLASVGYGVSRQALNEWLRHHPNSEVSQYISLQKEMFADVISTMGLYQLANPVFCMFWLKNQAGWVDKMELSMPESPPLGEERSQQDILASLPQITDDD